MPVKLLCDIAEVSKSGYYKWLENSDEEECDHEDYLLIKEIFEKGKSKFGWRMIQMRLKSDKKIIMNHKKIIRIKKKYQLITKIRQVNPYRAIMKKTQEHRTFDNLLSRDFKRSVPYKTFYTDITYLPFNHRMAYFSAVKDIASHEIVGWNVSPHIGMGLVMKTIEKMKNNKNLLLSLFNNIMMHSDQGFHYTNPDYIKAVSGLGMIQSMSRKGNCIDNAPMESFFGHLKDDVDYKDCKTFEELRLLIEEYVGYYNNERNQWDIKKMTPVQYRNHLLTTA